MTIIKFPSPKQPKSEFFDEIEEEGYHVFSFKNAKLPGYYPNKFPDYPGVSISDLKVGDTITIRVFFKIGTGNNIHVDGGYPLLTRILFNKDRRLWPSRLKNALG